MAEEARQNFANRIRIHKDLERIMGSGDSASIGSAEVVAAIAGLDRPDQDFIYHWADVIRRSNDELAVHFIRRAASAFALMDRGGVEQWLLGAMHAFDNRGLGAGIQIFEDLDEFAEVYAARYTTCPYEQIATFLQHFVRGLGGRELQLTVDRETFTDTEKIYLPSSVNRFARAEDNFRLFTLIGVHLWAQTWYGTWRFQVIEALVRDPEVPVTLPIFNRLECIRLDACIERDFPGLYRDIQRLTDLPAEELANWAQWREAAAALLAPEATALDALQLATRFKGKTLPALKPYQGEMYPNSVREVVRARVDREQAAIRQALAEMKQSLDRNETGDGEDMPLDPKNVGDFELSEDGDPNAAGEGTFELSYDGESVPLTDELESLLASIMQDFGEIPDDYMKEIMAAEYPAEYEANGGEHLLDQHQLSDQAEVILYREWDYTRQRFREGFCHLSEFPVPPGEPGFVEETLDKYKGLLKSIKKTFEAVLGESRLQRRQSQGDEIDLDALVEAHADAAMGLEPSEYVYMQYRNVERNIAVMFMVDMSGSTLGWVNDAERESLILLCEALETLGDRYAIYGFSGRTNKRCEIYQIKNFDERYDADVKERISGIRPKSYTRMGAAIRHLGFLLNRTHARTKILITLSDGRPEDYGGYKGRYGIEDTRHALLELRRDGIHSFCITIDKEAQDYLPHMYGAANYAVVDEVKTLPYKVADIYRRWTT